VEVDVSSPLVLALDTEVPDEKESALRRRAERERLGSACEGGGAVYTLLGEACGDCCAEEVDNEGSGLGESDVDSIEGRLNGDGTIGVWCCVCPCCRG